MKLTNLIVQFIALPALLTLSALAADTNSPKGLLISPLPDPLVMRNGRPVTTQQQWFHDRRPELKSMVQFFMYGAMPPAPKEIHFSTQRVYKNFFEGKATKKEVTITFGDSTNAPKLELLVIIPNAPKPKHGFPAFLGLNFWGNDTLLPVTDTTTMPPDGWVPKSRPGSVNNQANEKGRGTQVDSWAIEQTIDRGYAFASFYYGDIEPDQADCLSGLRAWLGQKYDTGAIAAWAWGVSRAIDYLVTDPGIDAKRIAVVGHSRNGKAALFAGAMDERIALTIPLQAGCGGTAPSRGTTGESVKDINSKFPHWFNAQYKRYSEMPESLPFDQNCVVALIAPRAVLFGAATEDQWANPAGQFEVLRAASPVYTFLNVQGLAAKQMPEPNQVVDSRLGYYIRPGKHSMTRDDWKVFLDFADKQMR